MKGNTRVALKSEDFNRAILGVDSEVYPLDGCETILVETSDIKKVNFVVQNRKVNNFNRCIIASISYNFNSFKDKYNGSGSADDEINRF